jgi:hypothetical protein
VAGRVLVRELGRRAPRRLLRVPDRLVALSGRRGLDEVAGQLGDGRVGVGAVQLLQRLADAAMDLDPPPAGQLLVQGLPHQRVGERVPPLGAIRLGHELALDRLLERRHQLVARHAVQPLEHVELELPADRGGHRQHLVCLLRQPVEATAHYLTDALRDRELPAAGRDGLQSALADQ